MEAENFLEDPDEPEALHEVRPSVDLNLLATMWQSAKILQRGLSLLSGT